MNTNKWQNITDPDFLAEIERYNCTNIGPLSHNFSPCSWSSGVTTGISVVNQTAFANFLNERDVTFWKCDELFQLYRYGCNTWPETDEDFGLYKDGLKVLTDEADGTVSDPFIFWRAVSKFMAPDTFFRVIETGSVGYAPDDFGRETSYFAVAITVLANGDVIAQDFEDYLVHP